MSRINAIPSTELATLIRVFFLAKRTMYAVGKPGIAKTAMVRKGCEDVGKALGKPFVVRELHLASMSEVDIRGYLIPDGDDSKFTKPEFWRVVEANEYGCLFLDEFPQAPHEVQKAVAPLILERRIGEWYLPDGWMVVCAGNSIEDNSGANSLLAHVLNRMSRIEVCAPDVDEWITWAAQNNLPPELIAIAKLRPDIVFNSDIPSEPDTPYCTPRSLHALGDIANAYTGGLVEMVACPTGISILNGTIGQGPAVEVAAMVRTSMRLPSYQDVMADPEKCPVPTKQDEAYAMAMLVAVRGDAKRDAGKPVQYLGRFPPNIALAGIMPLIRRDGEFLKTKEIARWVIANKEITNKFRHYLTLAKGK
jgi:hypothetical protein